MIQIRILLLLVVLCSSSKFHAQRVIHIVVALCDNQYQGIVKVPAGIGNGQDARTNLYWGAGYGVKTQFSGVDRTTIQPGNKLTYPGASCLEA